MERIACRCGWSVFPGLDCDFCGISAAEVTEYEATAAELREVTGLRLV